MTVWYILLEATLFSTVLYGAVWAFRVLFKKRLSAAMRCLLWFLVLARLMLPIPLQSGVSLLVVPVEESEAAYADALPSFLLLQNEQSAEGKESAAFAETNKRIDPMPKPEGVAAENKAAQNPIAPTQPVQKEAEAAPANGTVPAAQAHTKPAAQAPKAIPVTWETAVTAVWLLGAALMFLQLGISMLRLNKQLKKAQPLEPVWRQEFDELKRELKLSGAVKALMLEGFPSPALCAGLNPVVVFPKELLEEGGEKARFAMLHELTHVKRGDHITSLLLLLVRAVYWFNPVAWLITRHMRKDMETACDSRMTKQMESGEKKRYARALLSMYARPQVRYAVGFALGYTKKAAEKRIQGLFLRKRSSRAARLTASLLTLLLVFTCFTTACRPIVELVKTAVSTPAQTEAPQSGGAQPSAKPGEKPVDMEYKTLTVYWFLAVDYPEQAETMVKSIERELEKTYPNMKIDYYDPTGSDPTMDKQAALDKMYVDMMAGKGPDLIIGSAEHEQFGGTDMYKQMRSGAFLALDKRLEEDERMVMVGPSAELFDACSYNGKLCLLPLGYDLCASMISRDTLELTGIDPTACATADGYIGELEKFIAKGEGRSLSGSPGKFNQLAYLLASVYPNPEALYQGMDTPLFGRIVELADADEKARVGLYDESELEYAMAVDGTQYIANSSEIEIRSLEQGKAVYWDSFRIYRGELPIYSLFAEIHGGMAHIPVPNIYGGTTALLNEYAAVRRTSKLADEAWEYICALVKSMTLEDDTFPIFKGSNIFTGGLNWRRVAESSYWRPILFPSTMTEAEKSEIAGRPSDMERFVEDYASKINTALINMSAHKITAECFTEYFEGKASYETCFETAKRRLNIYLSE